MKNAGTKAAACPQNGERVLSGAKLPKMDARKAEYQTLAAEKRAAYKECRAVRKGMQEAFTEKSNMDRLLGLTDTQQKRNRG